MGLLCLTYTRAFFLFSHSQRGTPYRCKLTLLAYSCREIIAQRCTPWLLPSCQYYYLVWRQWCPWTNTDNFQHNWPPFWGYIFDFTFTLVALDVQLRVTYMDICYHGSREDTLLVFYCWLGVKSALRQTLAPECGPCQSVHFSWVHSNLKLI